MKTPREFLLNRHKSAGSKLDRMWNERLAPQVRTGRASLHPGVLIAIGWKLWRELVLPSRRIWACLACAWVVIAVLNVASSEPAMKVASQTKPPSREEMRALIEQRQMLAQLMGPMLQPNERHRRYSPGPRSERRDEMSTV